MSSAVATAVRERPIIFSGPMVRAILDGRKIQTRRVVKPQPHNPEVFGVSPVWGSGVHKNGAKIPGAKPGRFCLHAAFNEDGKRVDRFLPCPYGVPGDRLWVRETFSRWHNEEGVTYQATHNGPSGLVWTPSIHMPRLFSRLTLELTGVRLERVQELTLDDARAEGVQIPVSEDRHPVLELGSKYAPVNYLSRQQIREEAPLDISAWMRAHFASLWDSLNAKRGYAWASNPWVWVLSFRKPSVPSLEVPQAGDEE